jgi:hypothetical protein
VSFRLSNLNICRAGIAGFVCLAFVGACRGGEGARNIEIVPLHGTAMDTNFDQSTPTDVEAIKAWSPHAPRTIQVPTSSKSTLPRPQNTQNALSAERERELLDRRKNWVFMTPEDFASSDEKKDGVEKDRFEKKSSTAMERYYQRLNDAEQAAATNQLNKLNSDRLNGQTNLLGGNLRPVDGGTFGDSPFSMAPDSGAFDSVRRIGSAGTFGSSDTATAMPTPEDVRLQAEQKAHMESFKQIWNIDQPAAAPAPVATSVSAPVDSGPLFGMSSSGGQSASPFSSLNGNAASQSFTPVQSPATPQRSARPPRADFATPQRPF